MRRTFGVALGGGPGSETPDLELLGAVKSVALDDTTLTLSDADGNESLVYTAQ